MCSNLEIEDLHKITKNTDFVDPLKMKNFMEDFVNKSKQIFDFEEIGKLDRKLRTTYRVNPSKNQMREYFEKHFKNIDMKQIFHRYLVKKAMRSQSGVLVVTVTLSPSNFSCKYDCYYCPQETDLEGNHTQPRSYMSSEPAMRRATRYDFDVRGQFWDSIRRYINTGNIKSDDPTPKKMEVILSGGTWECYPKEERDKFIQECFWAANTFGLDKDRGKLSIYEEQKINETSQYRIIGLTLETRPDFINKTSIKQYRNYGVTRIQIGVQHYDDTILEKINRQCYTKHTINAIRLLKQVGLKVVVHLMPDLPGSTPRLDKWMFDMAIYRPDLQFDDVKIYPTAVCKSHDDKFILNSKIAEWYNEKTFVPYAEKNINDLINVIKYYFVNVKPWVRVQRCIRDIPGCSIEAGYEKKSNLRQLIQEDMDKKNEKTFELRTMEVRESKYLDYSARLVVRKYEASEGIEYHISMEAYEDDVFSYLKYKMFCLVSIILEFFGIMIYWGGSNNYVANFGFLRLRIDPDPGKDIISEIKNTAMIREVHVYGNSLGVGSDNKSSQHRGYGRKMISVAEDLAIVNGFNKTSVTSGIGSREYYEKKCGYHLEGTYMIKKLNIDKFTKSFSRISTVVLIFGLILIWLI